MSRKLTTAELQEDDVKIYWRAGELPCSIEQELEAFGIAYQHKMSQKSGKVLTIGSAVVPEYVLRRLNERSK